jgi:PAS domain S-box-containing protein
MAAPPSARQAVGGDGTNPPEFLNGGGEMGALMRDHDWSRSSLGSPSGWPQSLRTVVRLMLNTGHPMYIWWGADGACLYNDAYRESIGSERHPASLGQPARAVWDEIWDIIGPQIDQVMAGGGATWHEDHLVPITRHGRLEEVYWTYSYSPIDDETAPSGVGGVLVICTETTQKVLAERRLANEIQRQRRLFQCAPGFIAILRGPDHVFEFVNDAYVRLVGDREFLGKPVRDVIPEVDGQGYFEALDRVFATGERFIAQRNPIRFERTPAGPWEYRFLDFIYEPITDDTGKITGIFVEGIDATDRTLATEALRTSEARLRELNTHLEREIIERSAVGGRFWQISPDLLGVLKPDAHFENVNPAWTSALGWTEAELQSTPIFELLHPDDRARTLAGFEDLKAGNPIRHFENRYRRKDGGYNWLAWSAAPFGDAYYCSGHDITAQKIAQNELAATQDALRQAQKMEALGQLTGGVAHDFNNLLTIIRGAGDLLREPDLAEDRQRRYVDAITDAVQRATRLTSQLLAFARQQALKPEVFEVGARIGAIAEMLRTIVGARIAIVVEIAGDRCLVEADLSQFEAALVNIAVNARDAMDEVGTLTVKVEAVSQIPTTRGQDGEAVEFVAISLSDTGSGIKPELLANIFEPFFTTKEIGKGTGLGLSQVYGFSKQSGGDVTVESKVSRGTTFTLDLPRVWRETMPFDTASTARPISLANDGKGRRILVVEDNAEVGGFSTQLLVDLGYEATWVTSAAEALTRLADGLRIDVVFADVVMPGMSGLELGLEIRRRYPDLPVVLTSGYSHVLAEKGRHGFELLQKPYAAEELSRLLQRLAR